MNLSLDNVNLNEDVVVCEIKNVEIKRRFLDLGLSKNTIVRPVFNSVFGNIRAYKIRNSLIGIRNSDARNILVIRENE